MSTTINDVSSASLSPPSSPLAANSAAASSTLGHGAEPARTPESNGDPPVCWRATNPVVHTTAQWNLISDQERRLANDRYKGKRLPQRPGGASTASNACVVRWKNAGDKGKSKNGDNFAAWRALWDEYKCGADATVEATAKVWTDVFDKAKKTCRVIQ